MVISGLISGERVYQKLETNSTGSDKNGVYGESLLAKNNLEINGKDNIGELSIKLVNADRKNLYLPYSFLQEKKGMYMDSRIGDSVIEANSKEAKSYKQAIARAVSKKPM